MLHKSVRLTHAHNLYIFAAALVVFQLVFFFITKLESAHFNMNQNNTIYWGMKKKYAVIKPIEYMRASTVATCVFFFWMLRRRAADGPSNLSEEAHRRSLNRCRTHKRKSK